MLLALILGLGELMVILDGPEDWIDLPLLMRVDLLAGGLQEVESFSALFCKINEIRVIARNILT